MTGFEDPSTPAGPPTPATRRSRRAELAGSGGSSRSSGRAGPSAPRGTEVIAALPLRPAGAVRYWTVGLTVVVAGLLTVGAYAGGPSAAGSFLFAVVLLAWGWPALLGLPSPRGTSMVVALTGAGVGGAVLAARTEPRLGWLAFAIAAGLLAEFLHQLLRRDGRPRLVESVAGSVFALFVLASFSAVLALPRSPITADGVATWAAAVAGASLTEVVVNRMTGPLPVRAALVTPLAVLVAVGAGGLCGAGLAAVTLPAGALAGGVSGVVALVLHRLLGQLPAAGQAPGWLALAVAPLAASGMVGYVVLRLMVG